MLMLQSRDTSPDYPVILISSRTLQSICKSPKYYSYSSVQFHMGTQSMKSSTSYHSMASLKLSSLSQSLDLATTSNKYHCEPVRNKNMVQAPSIEAASLITDTPPYPHSPAYSTLKCISSILPRRRESQIAFLPLNPRKPSSTPV